MTWPWVVLASLTTAELRQSWHLKLTRTCGLGIESHPRADGFGFFDGFSCLGLILMKVLYLVPRHGSLPMQASDGCFGGQQILKGFVGIYPKLHCV